MIFWGPGERTASWTDLPVFYAHGLVSVHPEDWRSGGLSAARPLREADEQMIDDDACQVLRVEQNRAVLRLYLAERLDWRPRRVEHENLRGGLSTRVDIEYEQTPEGWFPKSWRVIDFLGDPEESKNRMLKEHRLTVVEREFNVATRPEEFRIALRPGMVVNRRDLPEFAKQRVNSEGKLVSISGLAAPAEEPPRWRWLVLMNVILGIIILAAMRRRRAAADGGGGR